MTDFNHDFTDAFKLLRECELPMTGQQLEDELSWPYEKKVNLKQTADKDLPKGMIRGQVGRVTKYGALIE